MSGGTGEMKSVRRQVAIKQQEPCDPDEDNLPSPLRSIRTRSGRTLTPEQQAEIARRVSQLNLPHTDRVWLLLSIPAFVIVYAMVQNYIAANYPERMLAVDPYKDVVLWGFISIRHLRSVVLMLSYSVFTSMCLQFETVAVHPQRREILLRSGVAVAMSTIGQLLILFGTNTLVLGAHGRPMSLPRSVQWCFSTPFLVTMVGRLDPSTHGVTKALLIAMVTAFGAIGTFTGSYFFIVISWCLFVPVFHHLYSVMTKFQKTAQQRTAKFVILSSWLVFPCVWIVDWFGLASLVFTESFMLTLDFGCKALLTLYMSHLNVYNIRLPTHISTALGKSERVTEEVAMAMAEKVAEKAGNPPAPLSPSQLSADEELDSISGLPSLRPSKRRSTSDYGTIPIKSADAHEFHRTKMVPDKARHFSGVSGSPAPIQELIPQGTKIVRLNAALVFVDVVNFTWYSYCNPVELMFSMLSDLFVDFDDLVQQHGGTKIKTMGDGYVAMFCGAENSREKNAASAVQFGLLAIEAAARDLRPITGTIRVGIDMGEIIYGEMGNTGVNDVWGSTVNVASRMESTGVPGQVHVSDAVAQLISINELGLQIEPREVLVKGIGKMNSALLCRK